MVAAATASAPGKLVLTGEYAVLAGGAAVSAATNVRAVATVQPAVGTTHSLQIRNTGERFRFNAGFSGPLDWLDNPGEFGAVLAALLAHMRQQESLAEPGALDLLIDTREFYVPRGDAHSAVKKGIGSSGAVVVALAGAVYAALSRPVALDDALAVHRDFQQQAGSGIDVVTSWHGGVVTMTPGNPPAVTPAGWPEGLRVQPVWTGKPASTTAMLARLEEYRSAHAAQCEELLGALCRSADAAAAAWQQADTADVLQAVQDYAQTLRDFDDATGTGIWSAEHQRLQRLAIEHGLIYKPSGAGGGDYGLIFADAGQDLETFMHSLGQEGHAAMAPGWSEAGLSVAAG